MPGAVIGNGTANLDRMPSAPWPAPQLLLSPADADGPVLVTVTYRVPAEDATATGTPEIAHLFPAPPPDRAGFLKERRLPPMERTGSSRIATRRAPP